MDKNFIWDYVQSCTAGMSPFSECGPVWQFGAISTCLAVAVAVFYLLVSARLREESSLATA